MSEKRLKIVLPIALLAFGAIVTIIMLKARSPVPVRNKPAYAPVVRIADVVFEEHQLSVTTQGTVAPRTEATLVSEVAGRVTAVAPAFAAGGFFNRGEVLVSIDSRDYELAVVTARGAVAQAKVRAETEAAQAKVAREEWEELGDGGNSPLATRELQLREARAALASAEAALEQAERNLERTQIRAPYDCRIRHKNIDVGQFATIGTPVALIYAIDVAEIRLPVPDVELSYLDLPLQQRRREGIKDGPRVLLSAEFAGMQRSWRGHIVRTEGEIDPVSRMVTLVAQVRDPFGRGADKDNVPLSIGLFVEAEIIGRTVERAVRLPRSALRGGNTVLIVDDEDRIHLRPVEVLRIRRDEAVITGGLTAGERVCITSLDVATEGMQVRTMGRNGRMAVTDSSSAGAEQ